MRPMSLVLAAVLRCARMRGVLVFEMAVVRRGEPRSEKGCQGQRIPTAGCGWMLPRDDWPSGRVSTVGLLHPLLKSQANSLATAAFEFRARQGRPLTGTTRRCVQLRPAMGRGFDSRRVHNLLTMKEAAVRRGALVPPKPRRPRDDGYAGALWAVYVTPAGETPATAVFGFCAV